MYQFHNPGPAALQTILAPGGAMEALLEAKAKGVVGHIGITAHLAAVFEAALDVPEIETIMFPYNIVEQQGKELIDRCAAAGKGFIDMKPVSYTHLDVYKRQIHGSGQTRGGASAGMTCQ